MPNDDNKSVPPKGPVGRDVKESPFAPPAPPPPRGPVGRMTTDTKITSEPVAPTKPKSR